MSTITKERLTELSRRENVGAILGEEIAELARIALASLEAEASGRNPVLAYADSYRDMANQGVESIPVWSVITDLERNIAPLFTAPPAPISVPAAMGMDDDFDSAFEHGKAVGWNAYRAAMLQSFGNSEQLNSPVIPDCWCRTCRPITLRDMRFVVCPECGNKRCPHANDHRNACTGSNEPGQEGSAYPAAPHQGAEPVTTAYKLQDGWVACSDRMPETMVSVLVTGTWFHHAVAFWDGLSWCDLDFEPPVTHWMPLPAAPQQEA
ncbi:DUF551 domain-containing protein [Enterobacter kobei]|uniref:DUF551 domain-containing protein n=1 Tax=Enterobacter kobei TaxID=208224 RepID=UPI001BD3545D|nr:DUF551 domain-containing protein [Enterobacter kobei]